MTTEETQAIGALTELTQLKQDNNSLHTGFGYGFPRWVLCVKLAEKLGLTFKQARKLYRSLAEKHLVIIKQNRYNGYVDVSLTGWDDCSIKGDYFIEKEG